MQKKELLAGLLAILLIISASPIVAQDSNDTITVPLGNLTLTAPEEVESRYAPVSFPHSLHFDYSCKTCHHMWEGDSEIQSCLASGCHAVGDGPRFSLAYHKTCRGCHRTMLDERKPTGPVKCDECHVKE